MLDSLKRGVLVMKRDEQRIVTYEFDGEFRYLGEPRVHVAAPVGEPWSWTSS